MKCIAILLSCFILNLISGHVFALDSSGQFSDVHLRNLTSEEGEYLLNTSSDGHVIFDGINLPRDKMCGVSLILKFKEPPLRSSLFDVYWKTAKVNFTESQKGFFMINQKDAAKKTQYILPLCKLFGFSGNLHQASLQANITGFRLDYPPNKNISVRIDSVEFFDNEAMTEILKSDDEVTLVEMYERVPARSFTSLDVILPKLVFAFEEGLSRLTKDLPFLIFWIILIFIFKLLFLKSFFGKK